MNSIFVNELNVLSWIFEEKILLSYSNFLKGCWNTIFQKDLLFLVAILIIWQNFQNEVKDRIHAEDTDNSNKVMICNTTIPSTSNTLNKLAVNKSFWSSYIKTEFND